MKSKTIKDHGWTPVLKGRIYCSPRCGRGCTKAEHDRARREANATLKLMKTRGWVVSVWENMGWHWMLENKLCGLSLHFSGGTLSGGKFYCMLTEGDAVRTRHGDAQFSRQFGSTFSNPNTAVKEMVKQAAPWFEAQVRGFANLKSIFQKKRSTAKPPC